MLDNKKGVVFALGYFDCLHLGHLSVIDKAKQVAKQLNANTVVFTFEGDLPFKSKGENHGSVYTLDERKNFLYAYGVDDVFCAPITNEFLCLSAIDFLQTLNSKYNILAYCCGEDYRFGVKGSGNVQTLKNFAQTNSQQTYILPDFLINGKKVSTSKIKGYLDDGNLIKANALLGRAYSVQGVVFGDRKVGSKLGFPTANVSIDNGKYPLKNGVYAGQTIIDGKCYKSVINYGSRPTFDLNKKLIETHIIDFSGDIYGKKVTVNFLRFLRPVEKFESVEQLRLAISKDVERVKQDD
jgi:riboflavin kinase/FMN adenylyltransferase